MENNHSRFYIDCEFDGHRGPLLSIAMVNEDGRSIHVRAMDAIASDPWVIENVVPLLDSHEAARDHSVFTDNIGSVLRRFIGDIQRPVIIADSPVDIGRFCAAISTDPDGGWASTDYALMKFEVHNVDCYPTALEGAVQHNAWWDAMALRHRLAHSAPTGDDEQEEEYMTVTLSKDGVVRSHNAFDADFDEMVRATETIITTLQARLSNRKFCPYSHGGRLKNTALAPTGEMGEYDRGLEAAAKVAWKLMNRGGYPPTDEEMRRAILALKGSPR